MGLIKLKLNKEYCVVKDKDTGELIIAQKVENGEVGTIHTITKYTSLKSIPITDVHEIKEGEVIIEHRLYNNNGKVTLGKNLL